MYTLITKMIWNKLGDKTGRSTLKIRWFTKFQRGDSKKILTYPYMHITLLYFKQIHAPTTIASFMTKPPLIMRADTNDRYQF